MENMNVQFNALAKKHGDEEAGRIADEIEALGGFGGGTSRGVGGLDLTGLLAESNNAISTKDKTRIAELAGVSRKELEKKIESGRKAVSDGDKSKDFIIPPDNAMDINRK